MTAAVIARLPHGQSADYKAKQPDGGRHPASFNQNKPPFFLTAAVDNPLLYEIYKANGSQPQTHSCIHNGSLQQPLSRNTHFLPLLPRD